MTTPDTDATFGARLRAAREAAGLTQEDAARRVGVGVRVYAGWERGEGEPRAASLVRLARSLAVTVEDLYPLAAEAA